MARISTLAASAVAAERTETERVHFVEARVCTNPKVCILSRLECAKDVKVSNLSRLECAENVKVCILSRPECA